MTSRWRRIRRRWPNDTRCLFEHEGGKELAVVRDRIELPHDHFVHPEPDDGVRVSRVASPRGKAQDDYRVFGQSPVEQSSYVLGLMLSSHLELVLLTAAVAHSESRHGSIFPFSPSVSLRSTRRVLGRSWAFTVYGESAKGGYLSVTKRKAYATTRFSHRMTPSTKSNRPFGYRPVNKMANQEMITTTIAAIDRKNSTM
jgi:hypothetical protein